MTSSDAEDSSDGARAEELASSERLEGETEDLTDTYEDEFEAQDENDDGRTNGDTVKAGGTPEDGTRPANTPRVRLTFRTESPVDLSRQPSFADGVTEACRPQTAAPRLASGHRLGSAPFPDRRTNSPAFAAAYGTPPGSPSASYLYHSGQLNTPRHPNGLPLRKPTGPLPGIPFLSDLVRRYPVRQAPPTGPEVSLIGGRLYVNERLRCLVSGRRRLEQERQPHGYLLAQSWTSQALVPVSGWGPSEALASAYLEARRIGQEQQAALAARRGAKAGTVSGEHGGGGGGGVYHSRLWGSYPGGGGGGDSPSAGAGSNRLWSPGAVSSGGGGGGHPERIHHEGGERCLELNDGASERADHDEGWPSSQGTASDDPSPTYQHYSVYQAYAGLGVSRGMGAGAGAGRGSSGGGLGRRQQGPPVRPSTSLPVLSRGGRRAGYDQKRGSVETGGGSPPRPPSQPAAWSAQRARAW